MAATAGLLVDHGTNEEVLVVIGGRVVRLDSIEALRFQQPEHSKFSEKSHTNSLKES